MDTSDDRKQLIERIKDDMRSRSEIREALISLINDYDLDPNPLKPFSTHTECYNELQMIEMIRDGFLAPDSE